MAFKSPGLYFTEIDNTEYTNPTAEINTTVAIIGFAKKGPIGVPTEITSYKEFKEIFGTPIKGKYSNLAVRSVLSAGGTVLYTRIADTMLATKSSVILKTFTPKEDGKLVINSKDDITVGTEGFENGKIYTGVITDATGKKSKTLVVRTPIKSKLSMSNLLVQLTNGLLANYGFTEYKIKKVFPSSYRSFSLKVGGKTINKETNEVIEADNVTYGPYYIQTIANDKETLAESINSVLSKGTNPYQKFDLTLLNINENGTIFLTDDQVAKKYFRVKFENDNASVMCLDLSKITDNSITVSELVDKLNDVLKYSNIIAEYCIDNSGRYILFVSTNHTNFEIMPALEDNKISEDTLFIPFVANSSEVPDENIYAIKSGSNYFVNKDLTTPINIENNFLLGYHRPVINSYVTVNDIPATVEYDSNTESLKFVVKNNINTNIQLEDSTITVLRPSVGSKYLFDTGYSVSTDTDRQLSELEIVEATNNLGNVGSCIISLKGETSSKITVARKKGQIFFKETDVLAPPTLEDLEEGGATLPITNLLGKNISLDTFVNSNLKEGNYRCLLQYPGSVEIPSYKNDMVIFTAKEYGSGTTNIGVEIYTTTSPFADENGEYKKTHYIDLFVNGMKKESWEDVSYNRKDDNYFINLINRDADNGGSSYITVIGKQVTPNLELNVPDTADISETGIVYVGQPIDENSVLKADDINPTAYDLYDYNVGNDGVPDETADLFTEAMDKYDSGLSNKDLYSWHILITPDNITQEVQEAAIELCEYMEDAIYIADPPQGLSRKGVVNWHNGKSTYRDTPFDSNFVCTYWPWCKVYDSSIGEYTWVMPSVVMAAQFCKVDKNYAPWYAPAGETNGYLSTVIDIEETPNKTDRDAMYLDQNRVNPFLKLRNGNVLAYGEKTTQRKNSTLTKIHTRRMLVALKKELRNAIKGFIFQPTAASNISKINSMVTSIMESYKAGGGIASYKVICDGSNNTLETLQQDILNVAISCVPVGCIEQVEISFTLNKNE